MSSLASVSMPSKSNLLIVTLQIFMRGGWPSDSLASP